MASRGRFRSTMVPDARPSGEHLAPGRPGAASLTTREGGGRREDSRGYLKEFYRFYHAPLVAWLRKRFGPGPPYPEDIAQTAFAKLIASNASEKADHIAAYLYAIAANAARDEIDWIRRTDRFIEHELREAGENLEEITPERVYSGKLEVDRLAQSMEQLSSKQREIVQRSRVQGQSYAQIAAETGWSMADISRQLTSALIFLRSRLDGARSGGRK